MALPEGITEPVAKSVAEDVKERRERMMQLALYVGGKKGSKPTDIVAAAKLFENYVEGV